MKRLKHAIQHVLQWRTRLLLSAAEPKLLITKSAMMLVRAVLDTTPHGIETSVALFGVRDGDQRIVLCAIGPGAMAIREPTYTAPDADYLNAEFKRLQNTYAAVEWLGAWHVHPIGMKRLSPHDHRTIQAIFAAVEIEDFVAGIILRRGLQAIVYPYLVNRVQPKPRSIMIEVAADDNAAIVRAWRLAKGAGDGCA